MPAEVPRWHGCHAHPLLEKSWEIPCVSVAQPCAYCLGKFDCRSPFRRHECCSAHSRTQRARNLRLYRRSAQELRLLPPYQSSLHSSFHVWDLRNFTDILTSTRVGNLLRPKGTCRPDLLSLCTTRCASTMRALSSESRRLTHGVQVAVEYT